jgi:hypothetical protein
MGQVPHIMLRDLLTQKCSQKNPKLILDSPEHVDLENIKNIKSLLPYLYQLFSKRDLNS